MSAVLIIVENLPVPLDYRVWLIATTLRAEGYDVSVISPASDKFPAGEFEIDGIKVFRHNVPQAHTFYQYLYEYFIAIIKEFFLSVKIYKKSKFKIIHACNPPDILWIIGLFWKLFGVKFIYDHHDLSPEILLAKNAVCNQQKLSFVHKFAFKILMFNEWLSHKFADVVLTTNKSFFDIAVNRNNCNPKKVFVVRTGPRLNDLPPRNSEKQKNKIAYVGVMAAQDGVDVLLNSIAYAVHHLNKNLKLILMGAGPEFNKLKTLAQKLNLQNVVEFTGFLTRKKMIDELDACSIGVTPDLAGPMNDHSTMLKVMDYMSCGLPQVMFDLPENRATAGESALYVQSGNEKSFAENIVKLLDDDELRIKLGNAARERVKQLSWENSGAVNLLKAYKKL